MLTNFVCDKKEVQIIKNSELKSAVEKKTNRVWIKASKISKEEEAILIDNFNIHPTTIEDISSQQTRIKYEEFEEYTLIIFKGIKEIKESIIETYNLALIIGENYVISVNNENGEIIEELSKNSKK